jgi:hypothetical protein
VNRRILAGVVIVVWLAALGWLARRELWRPRSDVVAEAALSLPPGAIYYIVSAGGRQLGYASTTVDTLGDTLRLAEVVVLDIPAPGDTHRTEVRTDVNLSRSLRLRDFTTTVRGDGGRFVVRGAVEADSVLALRLTGAGAESRSVVRLARPVVLTPLLAMSIALGGELVPGRRHSVRVLDPALLDPEEATLAVAAESTLIMADSAVLDSAAGRFVPVAWDTVRAWAIDVSGTGPARRVWVDEHGLPVMETVTGGFRIERSAFEIAYENFRRLGERALGTAPPAGSIVRRTVLAAGVAAPPAAGPRDRLRLALAGRPLDGLALDGDRQRLAGDTLTIRRERPEELSPALRIPTGLRDLAPYLRPTTLIQSTDPRMQAQARQAVERTRQAQTAAERLVAWVHRNVTRAGEPGGPSAIDVLETRRGDCDEHTILFTALARAVGLPARTVSGLVYLNGSFYYHAWPEVYLGTWVAVDPTFGQFPADAGHVRLAIGGLARQSEMARLLGELTITVLPDQNE